jgi:hypothetical protein
MNPQANATVGGGLPQGVMAAAGGTVHNVQVGSKFLVAAVSRHPRLGIDYDSRAHRYTDTYLKPRTYGIAITDFPGKKLIKEASRDLSGALVDPLATRSWWQLNVPLTTTGWKFSVTGRVNGSLDSFSGPFSASHFRPLPTPVGQFDDEGTDNAWNWRFDVPGPGRYAVEVTRLDKNPQKSTTQSQILQIEDHLVVSIGDSAASGQGNPDKPGRPADFKPDIPWWKVLVVPLAVFELTKEALDWSWNRLKKSFTTLTAAAGASIDMDPEPVWLEPRAYRSLRGGHSLAAAALEDRRKGRLITYLHFGRTDSTIRGGLIGARTGGDGWIGGRGQIQEIKDAVGSRRIDALLVYVGINEIGVSENLSSLAKDFQVVGTVISPAATQQNRDKVRVEATRKIQEFRAKFKELEEALDELDIRHVYVTEYPESLFQNAQLQPAAGCGIFASDFQVNIGSKDAELIGQIIHDVNSRLRSEVKLRADQGKGWFYIGGIAEAFAGHGYCARDSYFRFAEESLALQGDTQGSVHPNAKGAEKIAERVANEVLTHTINAPHAPALSAGASSTPSGGGTHVPATFPPVQVQLSDKLQPLSQD